MPSGPGLGYDVVSIDIPTNKSGVKSCFHPKQSYILLEDWSLIVIGGSNNLTQSAWCSNIECVNVFQFTPYLKENERFFPRTLKDRYKDFCRNIRKDILEIEDRTKAEEIIDGFFSSIKYTKEEDVLFFNSGEEIRNHQEKKDDLRLFDVFIERLKQKYNEKTNLNFLAGDAYHQYFEHYY
jgi:hypothetical protein